ncbi:enoyl-CoA hydratase/isomerase family protein [Alicyclobacillus tolerans]|nr:MULTISPECIES: enoyl-CoA hydratase/isomerase family protein [Alicyclobacillus]SHJ66945.1 short chain enoyl-CoA hydratase /Enoyl-CoA hydratase [Alicyclobacillus montanus]
MEELNSQSVLLEDDKDGVRLLTLNRPETYNAVNGDLSSNLINALRAASANDAVRVIVLTGSGKGFCSGLDLSTVESMRHGITRHQSLDPLGWVGHLALAIRECDKPVIAAINGIAAGAGMAMALACDLRFMATSAKLTTGYIRRGLSPDAGMSYFLPRLIGWTRASEWILSGRDISSMEAEQVGLVNEVFADGEFMSRVMAYATNLAEHAPIAMTLSKRLLHHAVDADLQTQLREEYQLIQRCFATEDVAEGVRAFLEKRKPNFQGR